ncbi:Aspartyl/glutamyl-tRNA(Asn/Gln) amidotransferase subunit B [uncultured Desulfobacterium sp.]|uniref:Aspartyl/glutamyl-tRNA(Asn/Gln) amidotransferase subunit B n=1 Tax=uncultured Desulfobacterium sp. TaxID=201089 RepID=A0A445MTP3_9BACT|nr:Aspartyl/glutamyl-tRNA(Asn/Gln) amidotransferase subunit B [uncultured Desulfobacterium sp.]
MIYDVIICFETHVELKTQTKLFCDCKVAYDAPANSRICPVCTGQPGALPVLNKKAVEFAIRAGLALNCTINHKSRFARKNYFYPDLPKGYQISQYELPFCENGFLEITSDDGNSKKVGIKRIHLEEDAGKLVHSSESLDESDYSLVDYNRSSVPLLEIVCDHDQNPLRSVREARAYLEKMRQTLRYIGISDCMLEKGQFRNDVNVSIRPKGEKTFGNRAEIKNMSSFRFITEALEYEIKRQTEILDAGGCIDQETRLFDESVKTTFPMRSKENAPDYRYFPDPDLVEVEIDREFISLVEKEIPELPEQKLKRIMEQFNIPKGDAIILTKDKAVSDFFGACAPLCDDKRRLSNWIIKELFRLLNNSSAKIEDCTVSPENFSHLINLIARGEITEGIARAVLEEMFQTGKKPESIIDGKGLRPLSDIRSLGPILDEVMAENQKVVEKISAGDTKPMDFLIGQVMRKSKGKADARKVKELVQQRLEISL